MQNSENKGPVFAFQASQGKHVEVGTKEVGPLGSGEDVKAGR